VSFVQPLNTWVAQAVKVVGTSSSQLSTGAAGRILTLQADPNNTGTIYLGDTSSVTNAPALAHTALKAGDFRMVSLSNLDSLYAVASAASQKLLIGVAS
jgi:hypothetical protein